MWLSQYAGSSPAVYSIGNENDQDSYVQDVHHPLRSQTEDR